MKLDKAILALEFMREREIVQMQTDAIAIEMGVAALKLIKHARKEGFKFPLLPAEESV